MRPSRRVAYGAMAALSVIGGGLGVATVAAADSFVIIISPPEPEVPTRLLAPADLTASFDRIGASLSWAPVAGADGYNIYRGGEYIDSVERRRGGYYDPDGHDYAYYSVTAFYKPTSLYSPHSEVVRLDVRPDFPDFPDLPDVPPPTSTTIAAPEDLAATVYSSTAVGVQWDKVDGATRYVLSRNGTVVYDSNADSFWDDGLAPGTVYHYKLVVFTGNDESATYLTTVRT